MSAFSSVEREQVSHKVSKEPFLYLHGLPGSAQTDMTIALGSCEAPSTIASLERLPRVEVAANYRNAILDGFDQYLERSGQEKVRLIGFSLGAMPTLHIAAARAAFVSSIDLIAPAAPLQLGSFLENMAGRPVFEAASAGKFRLGLLTGIQSLGLRVAPNTVAFQLFKSAPEIEKSLMAEPVRLKAFINGMRYAICEHAAGYRKELNAYVRDWSDALPKVYVPVCIWQGTADNWAPPDMAKALASTVAGQVQIEWLEGLSHYGALAHALSQIVRSQLQ